MKKFTSSVVLSALTFVAILPVGVFWLKAQMTSLSPAQQVIVDDSDLLGSFTTTGKWMKGKMRGAAYLDGFTFSSSGKATWKFTVAPGTYSVDVSQTRWSMVSPLYSYAVSDGVASIGSFTVDQRFSNQNYFQSIRWKNGGTFTTTTTTLLVELSTNRTMVIADAVRITPVAPPVVSSSSSSVVSSAPAPRCGDAIVNNGEQCDSGAMNDQPCMAPAGSSCVYCNASCIRVFVENFSSSSISSSSSATPVSSAPAPRCGDGIVQSGEHCDHGSKNGQERCTAPYGGHCQTCNEYCYNQTWQGGYCGDGVVNGSEQCDTAYANGNVCNPWYGASCQYCTRTCSSVVVVGPRCGDGIVNGSEQCDDANTVETDTCTSLCKTITVQDLSCIDTKDNDSDAAADIISVTSAVSYNQVRRQSVLNTDERTNRSYFMYQDEGNRYQTIDIRDAETLRQLHTVTFDKDVVRKDVFGSPAIDPQVRVTRKPYHASFISNKDATAVFGVIADFSVANVEVEGSAIPEAMTLEESKIVRYSADLRTIDAVLSTGIVRFQSAQMKLSPDGKTLVALIMPIIKKKAVPTVKVAEYGPPSLLFIDTETFTVKKTVTLSTPDLALSSLVQVENDRIVYLVERRKQPGFIVGMFVNTQWNPAHIVEYIPSTGVSRTVDLPADRLVQLLVSPQGNTLYILTDTKSNVSLMRVNTSTLAYEGSMTLTGNFKYGTKLLKVLPNGYIAATRTRPGAQLYSYEDELLLFHPQALVGSSVESETRVSVGSMLQTPDASVIYSNVSLPYGGMTSLDTVTSRIFNFNGTTMVMQKFAADAQCTSLTSLE